MPAGWAEKVDGGIEVLADLVGLVSLGGVLCSGIASLLFLLGFMALAEPTLWLALQALLAPVGWTWLCIHSFTWEEWVERERRGRWVVVWIGLLVGGGTSVALSAPAFDELGPLGFVVPLGAAMLIGGVVVCSLRPGRAQAGER